MSGQRRPSPIQPPLRTDAEDHMAQLQRPPSFPASDFLGRPERRNLSRTTLPPIQTATRSSVASSCEGPVEPLFHLPPLQASTSRTKDSTKVLSISQLVSSNEPSPQELQAVPTVSRPVHYSPSRNLKSSPIDYRKQPQAPNPKGSYRFDQPATSFGAPTFGHRTSKTQYPSTGDSRILRKQDSPAVTSDSSLLSYYDSQSEVSPRASVATLSQDLAWTSRVREPPPFKYSLIIRQQPAAARACGFGDRDRRVIDPPPILELKITEHETDAPAQDYQGLLALHCTLLSPDSHDDQTEVPPAHPEMPATRRLMGTLVASPYPAKDEHGVAGQFFVFPDLSCRSPGRYRLQFKLLRIDPQMMTAGVKQPTVASILSDVFSVFTAKDFPGMRASSALLKSLRRQGLNVGVKKGSEARKGKAKAKKENSTDEETDDSEGLEDARRGSLDTAATDSTGTASPKTKTRKKKRVKRKRRDS